MEAAPGENVEVELYSQQEKLFRLRNKECNKERGLGNPNAQNNWQDPLMLRQKKILQNGSNFLVVRRFPYCPSMCGH